MADNVSPDLIWQICNNSNSFLVKRKAAGGVQFSRDPLNLTNKHSRKYAGFVNQKAIGVQLGEDGKGLKLLTKTASKTNKPASNIHTANIGGGASSRKSYRTITNSTTKRGYRSDLRGEAVARASALKYSQKAKKDAPAPKVRGAKAKKAAESLEV